jgi:hypothetical protein
MVKWISNRVPPFRSDSLREELEELRQMVRGGKLEGTEE